MTSGHTFHIPSFGDEDFDLSSLNFPSSFGVEDFSSPLHCSQSSSSLSTSSPVITQSPLVAPSSVQQQHSQYVFEVPSLPPSQPATNNNSVSSSSFFNYHHQPQQLENSIVHQHHQSSLPIPVQGNEQLSFSPTAGIYNQQNQQISYQQYSNSITQSPGLMEQNFGFSDESDDNLQYKSPAFNGSTNFAGSEVMSPTLKSAAGNGNDGKEVKKQRKKRDPNEPQKPVSAYALFFRDTQAAIKGQNPEATFGEVSKIVASMWDALDPEHKNVYKKKTEAAKRQYLRLLAEYRAKAVSKGEENHVHQETTAKTVSDLMMTTTPSTNKGIISPKDSLQAQTIVSGGFTSPKQNVYVQRAPSAASPRKDATGFQNTYQQQPLEGSNEISSHQQMQQQQQQDNAPISQFDTLQAGSNTIQKCMRNGCTNQAVINPDWEDEYCSNECVVVHCRDVFSRWVQNNTLQESF